MPDDKQKLVQVPGTGVVAFPNFMSDDQIASALKGFRTAKTPKAKGAQFPLPDQVVKHAHNIELAGKLKSYTPSERQKGAMSPDFPVDPNEAGYTLFGGDSKNPQSWDVNFSFVPEALKKGYIWSDPKENERYIHDLAQRKEGIQPNSPMMRQFGEFQEALQPVPGGDPTMNLIKSFEQAIYIGAPSFVVNLAKAQYTDATGQTRAAFGDAVDPAQIPEGLYKQYQQDKQTDPSMAQTNLVGNLLGLWAMGKVGHGLHLDTTEITPEQVPAREKTRVVHSNPVGEVRMGNDGVPTVWLRPKAWYHYVRTAHPYVSRPGTILGENVALGPKFEQLTNLTGSPSYADWKHISELLKKAQEASKTDTAVLARQAGKVSDLVKVLREEKIHTWQRRLSETKGMADYLAPHVFTNLAASIPASMRTFLSQTYGEIGAPTMVNEAAARFIASDLTGTSVDEASSFLKNYFDAVVQQHGTNALTQLEHARGIARQMKEAIDAEHSGTNQGATPAGVRGVPEGRQGGVAPIAAPEPAAAFRREPAASGTIASERRVDLGARKRISEMTPEEMRHLLLHSQVVDLPNRRAFDEVQALKPSSAVAMSDADGLKAFNDRYGYAAGDELLKAKAEALKEAGLEAYHDKGDEFRYRANSSEELRQKLEKAREILRNKQFDVLMDDGRHYTLKGVDFSYGTGADIREAERGLHANKLEREQRGERKRGELAGITATEGQGGAGPAPVEQAAFRRDPDELMRKAADLNADWLLEGVRGFATEHGRVFEPGHYATPDERATEIADAYEAMEHKPNDPAVKAAYNALKRDIDQQWKHGTEKLGIHFEPWKQPGQPYENSAQMMEDVRKNHHLYFFQGGELPSDHPMAEVNPETGLSWNDELRAVHDIYGHAVGGFQFGPRGEENAWIAHAQMFSPDAIPALTSETKGQNSWVNFGPQMRNAQGEVIRPGEPGYLEPNQRSYALNKAGLLPSKFFYRVDAPISFISSNVHNLDFAGAQMRLGSRTHVLFQKVAADFAHKLGLATTTNSAVGFWHGGAENSTITHFPYGTDPDLVTYHNALMAKVGNQFGRVEFIQRATGKDRLYAFHVDRKTSPDVITKALADSGIENGTMESDGAGGHVVWVASKGEVMRPKVADAAERLGEWDVAQYRGETRTGGSDASREAAGERHTRIIEALEKQHPEWREIRRDVESGRDYDQLHRFVRETREPFVEGRHHTRVGGIDELQVSKEGTARVYQGADRKYMEMFPDLHVPRIYYQIKGTLHEPWFRKLPHKYRSILNSENIYDMVADPDEIWPQISATNRVERLMRFEKAAHAFGYDGIFNPNTGMMEVFKDTPAEEILEQEGSFSRKPRTWNDIKKYLTEEERARHSTKEKQDKLVEAVNLMPSSEEWDAFVKMGLSGKLWYERSSRAFDALLKSMPDRFKLADKPKFLNFVAALSPVQPVRQNLLMAINLWDKWDRAGRPMDVEWKDENNYKDVKNKNTSTLFRILQGRRNSFGVDLKSRMYNAIRALQGQPMSGPKVSAFAPNLGEDFMRSTNDTWMAILAGIDPNAINKPHLYDAVSAMVREAAKKNNIQPRQAQAAAWSFIKTLAEVSGWGKYRWRPPEELLKKGLLTPELIDKHAADFADLLANDPEIRERIKDIGGNLDALDRNLEKHVPGRPATQQESATAILTRLLGAARRLETAREDARIQAHLAAKSGPPTLFDTSFNEGSFRKDKRETTQDTLAHQLYGMPYEELDHSQQDDVTQELDAREEQKAKVKWTAQQEETQLAKTTTPEFKAWFGYWEDKGRFSSRTADPNKAPVSQVIDPKTGRPQVLYHGTHGDFSAFETGRPTKNYGTFGSWDTNRHGIFMTHDPEVAEEYLQRDRLGKPTNWAKVMPVYANIKNPLDLTNEGSDIDQEFLDQIEKEGINPNWVRQTSPTWELFDDEDGKQFVEALQRMGYDGAKFDEESHEDPEKTARVWVAFQPAQIKSAIGNRGSFDSSNPDIAFRRENPWYLKSDKIIEEKMRGPMPADAVLKMLENNGVKPDELKYVGIEEFLKSKGKESIKPEELRKYLAAAEQNREPMTQRSSAPREVINKYLRSGCIDLAVALHRRLGLPLYGAFDKRGSLHHVFVVKDGQAIDIRGRIPLADVATGSRAEGGTIEPMTEKEVEKHANFVLSEEELKRAGRDAKKYLADTLSDKKAARYSLALSSGNQKRLDDHRAVYDRLRYLREEALRHHPDLQ